MKMKNDLCTSNQIRYIHALVHQRRHGARIEEWGDESMTPQEFERYLIPGYHYSDLSQGEADILISCLQSGMEYKDIVKKIHAELDARPEGTTKINYQKY